MTNHQHDGFSKPFQMCIKQDRMEYTAFINALVVPLSTKITELVEGRSFVVTLFPSSKVRESSRDTPLEQLVHKCGFRMETLLRRHTDVESAHSGGIRSVDVHEDSISYQQPISALGVECIVLLDDVITTGNSLEAGANILRANLPDHFIILQLAIASTCTDTDVHTHK